MKMTLPVLLLLAAVSCGQAAEPTGDAPGKYARPDIAKLLAEAKRLEPAEERPEDYSGWLEFWSNEPVYRAVWSSIERAEERGLHEMYGVEEFVAGEGTDYEALFFLRTGRKITCLYGRMDLHPERPDQGTVPAAAVKPEVLALLRRRVKPEVPFVLLSSEMSQTLDGAYVLVHVFRKGKSHAALWYSPEPEHERTRESIEEHAEARPVLAIRGALWAAAPPDLFPRDRFVVDLPDERLWEGFDQEVYNRAPGYE